MLLATMTSPHVNRLEVAAHAAKQAAGSAVAMAAGQTGVSTFLRRGQPGHASSVGWSMGLLSLVDMLSQEISSLVAKLMSDRPKDSDCIKRAFGRDTGR